MPSDAEVWWDVMHDYVPLKPYFDYWDITGGGHTSILRRMIEDGAHGKPSWRKLLLAAGHESPLERAIGAKRSGANPLNPADALEFFQENYPLPSAKPIVVTKKPESVFQSDPSVSMGLSIIPTASAEPEPVSLPSIYGAQYVPDVFLRRPGEVYTSSGEVVEISESVEYKRVKVIDIVTGIVVFDGSLTVENIKLHQDDPRYRVEFVETEPEPEPMTTCIDVYRLSNGSVTTNRETVSYETMADYVNVQHLLVRECGQSVPTTQEVKTWYGYFEPEPESVSVPVPEPVITEPFKPGMFNTNILVGLLAGGALAVPILDDLLKTKKKRRR